MGGTIESWDLVAPMLSTKRRVLRYDTRGAGLSQKIRPPLTIDSMADDLVALLDELGRPPLLVEPVARAISGARYVVLETGHYAPIQTPELYVRTVDEFLDAIRA